MNPPALALSAHAPDETLALGPQGPVTAARFFADAQSVAEALPASQYVLNTCHDRYLFMVGLGAALLAGRPTLMPSSLAPESVRFGMAVFHLHQFCFDKRRYIALRVHFFRQLIRCLAVAEQKPSL